MNKKKILIIVAVLAIAALAYYFLVVVPGKDKVAASRKLLDQWGSDHGSDGPKWQGALSGLSDTDAVNMAYIVQTYMAPGAPNLYTTEPALGAFWDAFRNSNNLG